jgi:nucleoside-diphosphate-sugar epimerase
LVIGGTGPSGQAIIAGLLERGHQVSMLHTGQHEVELPADVEHIHTDPHFEEPLAEGLNKRNFDIVIATYGRVRIIADVVAAKTGRLITVSGSAYAAGHDPQWGPLGVPLLAREDGSPMQETRDERPIPHKVWLTEQYLLRRQAEGAFDVTIVRYPLLYGPGSPANPDWSIVRRALEKRSVLVLGDGGRRVRNRGYAPNVAHGVLLAADNPAVSSGKVYNVADTFQFPQRATARYIAELLSHEFEIIDVPEPLGMKVYGYFDPDSVGYYAFDTTAIVRDLGYADTVPPAEAVKRSVEWLAAHPIAPESEAGRQIADPFDYRLEDELARIYKSARVEASQLQFAGPGAAHMYRHPKKPFDAWTDGKVTAP